MITRLIYFGTSEFAVPALERLASDPNFKIVAVVTQPDRPVGRKAILTSPPIKITAQKLGLPVLQFEKVISNEAFEKFKSLNFDLAVIASFGQIISQRVLNLARLGFINIHGSILPKYRGASPIAEAIKNGDAETGITIMLMDALMDHGATLSVATEMIRSDDTTESLSARLSVLGADLLMKTLPEYLSGEVKPVEQNHTASTSVKLLKREDGLIEWNRPAFEIERTIRAYFPWPGTFTLVDSKRVKILTAHIGDDTDKSPGTFFDVKGQLMVACGQGSSLFIDELQPEGKAAMTGQAYLLGHQA